MKKLCCRSKSENIRPDTLASKSPQQPRCQSDFPQSLKSLQSQPNAPQRRQWPHWRPLITPKRRATPSQNPEIQTKQLKSKQRNNSEQRKSKTNSKQINNNFTMESHHTIYSIQYCYCYCYCYYYCHLEPPRPWYLFYCELLHLLIDKHTFQTNRNLHLRHIHIHIYHKYRK